MFENHIVLLMKLVLGIQAIQQPRLPVPQQRAAVYARAALYHAARKHLDPFELVALARNESDFSERTIGPDGLDCGLTQTRITYSRYSCEELQRSPWLAFAEAARELSAYARSCRGHADYDRCRLNRYNSGHRYARHGFHGRYYLRIACFAEAARRLLPLAPRCRLVQSEEQLARWVREAGGAPPAQPETRLLVAQAAGPPGYGRLVRQLLPPWEVTVLAIDQLAGRPPTPAMVERPGRTRVRARRALRPRGLGHHAQRPLHLLVAAVRLPLGARQRGAAGAAARQDAADGGDHARARPSRLAALQG